MKPRLALTIAAAASFAASAHAQELVHVTYSWTEVLAGTLTPVPSPNSVLEPGEGARIGFNLYITLNGTDAIGQTTTYTPPPPTGIGTIRAIASMYYDLIGDNRAPSAAGSWTNRAVCSLLHTGSFAGNILNGGATVDSISGGQFVAPGQTADGSNPIQDAFRGVWTPVSYQARTVHFKASNTVLGATGQNSGILLQYGFDPTAGFPLYLTKYIAGDFGNGINIPISPIPTPSAAALLALGTIWSGRRRRPT